MSDYHPYLADWDEDEQRAAKRYGVERGRITGTKGDASDMTKQKAKRQTSLISSIAMTSAWLRLPTTTTTLVVH